MADEAKSAADHALNQRIRQTLHAEPSLGMSAEKVRLSTDNGEVTLQGTVTTEKEKADIAAKVQQVAGVKKVNNQLQMAPRMGGAASESPVTAPSGSKSSAAGGSTSSSGSTTNK